jgi:hypothetical protein
MLVVAQHARQQNLAAPDTSETLGAAATRRLTAARSPTAADVPIAGASARSDSRSAKSVWSESGGRLPSP